ncbi:MAG: DUF1501 domain-containing protein [Pseudomonadales bacterium]|nr:DUF1501 domain-containing protein [Pseudomonadales bacterium]NRA16075.1 DUF1501 domain-containing protein [Oceanospirillaceae bacterium]
MKRRSFLHLGAAGAFSLALPNIAMGKNSDTPVLILIELNGGNDSHNTVLDLNQLSLYKKLRPQLGLAGDERVQLDKNFALHRSLKGFVEPWQQGELALVHGLGYANANKSHFRSIEIWDMASASDQYLSAGWLANVLPKLSPSAIDAMVFGRNAVAFSGGNTQHIQLKNLKAFFNQSKRIKADNRRSDNSALSYLLGLKQNISDSKELMMQGLSRNIKLKTKFPKSIFGQQMADVAKVIRMDLQIPAFKVAIGSFDTHKGQKNVHRRLLQQVADGMLALRSELQTSGHWPNVLMMTYSEFGRRAAQNGSGGCDHGTAASHFLMGGRVKGGHYGDYPAFDDLQNRDVIYNVDFRSMYQSVVQQWWQQPGFELASGLESLDIIHRA